MAEDSASDKAIKKSAEGIEPPPSRKTTPALKDSDPLYHELIVALDEAGMLPHDWAKCNMFNYAERPDILVNFYVKDKTQDPLDLVDRYVILSYRITDDGDGRWILENT